MITFRVTIYVFLFLSIYFFNDAASQITRNSFSSVYNVTSSWDKAFKAHVKLRMRIKTVGWILRFQFTRPLERFNCWECVLLNVQASQSASSFRVTNKSYNGILNPGDIFKFEFIGYYAEEDSSPPPVHVYFGNTLIYRSQELLQPTPSSNRFSSRISPALTTTGNIVDVLSRYFAQRNSLSAQNTNSNNNAVPSIFHQLNNQFSPVEPAPPDRIQTTTTTTATTTTRSQETIDLENLQNELGTEVLEGSAQGTIVSQSSSSSAASTKTTQPIISTRLPNVKRRYSYAEVLHKSLLFYEAQRSGQLPSNKRLSWTESSALFDKGVNGEDLTGGYYDGGDYVKFGFPMAFSITMLAWGVIEYWDVYEATGELSYAVDALRWGTDYFMKAHVDEFKFYGQVGNPEEEHKQWGRPDTIPKRRPAYILTKKNPGSELVAETAAALAAVSIVIKKFENGITTAYVSELLRHATELFEFGKLFRRHYHFSIPTVRKFYRSTSYKDELVWASAWLYRATNITEYLNWAEGQYQNWVFFSLPKHKQFSWDDKTIGIQMLLAQISTLFKDRYKIAVKTYCSDLRSNNTFKTPRGLIHLGDWSPLRYAANSAFICLMAADFGIDPEINRNFSKFQIDYMLGDAGRSYVVGFGENYPKQVHHRSSSCPPKPNQCGWDNYKSQQPNPTILTGALVGGPDRKDAYKDNRALYNQSEVTLDHNAGFQGAIAALQNQLMFPNKMQTREDRASNKTITEIPKQLDTESGINASSLSSFVLILLIIISIIFTDFFSL